MGLRERSVVNKHHLAGELSCVSAAITLIDRQKIQGRQSRYGFASDYNDWLISPAINGQPREPCPSDANLLRIFHGSELRCEMLPRIPKLSDRPSLGRTFVGSPEPREVNAIKFD